MEERSKPAEIARNAEHDPGRDACLGSLLADREKDYPDNLSTWSGTHGMFRMRSTSGETQKTIGLSQ